MSSKRRKLITSTKLPTDVPTLLADGVREAVRTSGVNSANVNVDEMAASIAADPVTNASYREALKENIKERLKKDPDFDPEKFPNSAKFTEK
jgi:large proline-rich protein BAG6